jgi:hypothetical protein
MRILIAGDEKIMCIPVAVEAVRLGAPDFRKISSSSPTRPARI